MTTMPNSSNPADAFFSQKSPSAKFEVIGTVVGGPIVRISDPVQQTNFSTGAPEYWDAPNNTQPKMQLPITVQTDLRDPANPTDNGERTLWVKGHMKKAIEDAISRAGAGLQVGGTLLVAFVGEEASGKGSPTKLYQAQYTPPAAGGDFFAGAQQPVAQPVQQPVQQPVAQPVAQPVQQPVQQPVAQPVQQPVAQPAAPAAPALAPNATTMTQEQIKQARAMGFNV